MMREDDKMLNIGIWMAAIAFVASVFVQVAYRTQNRMRMQINRDIVQSQQDFAQDSAMLSALMRPEVLRGIVMEIYPDYQTIGWTKNINISEIELRTKEPE